MAQSTHCATEQVETWYDGKQARKIRVILLYNMSAVHTRLWQVHRRECHGGIGMLGKSGLQAHLAVSSKLLDLGGKVIDGGVDCFEAEGEHAGSVEERRCRPLCNGEAEGVVRCPDIVPVVHLCVCSSEARVVVLYDMTSASIFR